MTFRAFVRSRPALIALAMASLLAACAMEPPSPIDSRLARELGNVHLDPVAAESAINAYRSSRGLEPLRLDPALTAMAQRQADAMVAGDALSHTVGGPFLTRLAAAGIVATEAGENLGAGYFTLDEAMAGWRGSAEHDANLRMAGATRMGVAIAKSPHTHYGVYWALELAADQQRPSDALRTSGL
jgi:uncharacterized protein YkwD